MNLVSILIRTCKIIKIFKTIKITLIITNINLINHSVIIILKLKKNCIIIFYINSKNINYLFNHH